MGFGCYSAFQVICVDASQVEDSASEIQMYGWSYRQSVINYNGLTYLSGQSSV